MANSETSLLRPLKSVASRMRSAIKIKGFQGRHRVEWLKVEYLFTAISAARDVHANHNEAHNSCIRRRCSAYWRRQNHYAKTRAGLQRAITVQRLSG